MDIVEFWEPFVAAKQGDLRQLAAHIKAGGDLDPLVREWLADYLIAPPKAPRRTYAQKKMEYDLVRKILWARIANGGSDYAALKSFLEHNPDMELETMKTYLKKWKKGI